MLEERIGRRWSVREVDAEERVEPERRRACCSRGVRIAGTPFLARAITRDVFILSQLGKTTVNWKILNEKNELEDSFRARGDRLSSVGEFGNEIN